MKKVFSSVLSVVMVSTLLLSGCGKSNDASSASPSASSAPSESTAPSASVAPSASTAPDGIVNQGVIAAEDPSKNPSVATDRKDTLIVGVDAPDGVFNPIYMESAYDQYVTYAMFNDLVQVAKDGTYAPWLATKWDISEDKLTYTFHLDPNAKFSDGSPLTADDVAFTELVLHDKSYDGPIDMSQAFLKGGDAYREGKATSIEGIEVVDAHTIKFTTTKVSPRALPLLGGSVLSKAYYGKGYKQGSLEYMKDLNQKPLGNGPYVLTKYTAGQEVDMKVNDNYYAKKPSIPNLIYKVTSEETRMQMLQSGEVDMDMVTVNKDNVDELKSYGFLNIDIFPTNGYGYIAFNHKKEQFKDQKVRQALAYGLNRKDIVDAVYQGYADVINVPQSKVSWAYAEGPNAYEYDPEKAKALLDEAGWKVGADGIREKDGKKFKINFVASSPNAVNDAIIPIAKENYKALGIEFVPDQMEFNKVRENRKAGNFDMLFMAWGLVADPDSTDIFGTNGSQNDDGYSNPKVDELLAKGLTELDPEKRKPFYADLYKAINEDLPYIFMYQRRDMWAINSRIEGFDLSPYKDFYLDLTNISIKP
ncbi:ABC transporter substrate-binding protein [Gorillibacterium sp. sgz500922]|uniref:ABC transporter substrate-binding protein n=1 Tax=Gorillibacterium sp. sgz500922 TaxID=3446694 RepID=UPI003F66C18D